MEVYEVTSKTCALVYLEENKTEVIEDSRSLIINNSPLEIIKQSCEYYGSSFEGRLKGSQKSIGMFYKLPIIIEASNDIIFFPTLSTSKQDCSFVSLKNVEDYKKEDNNVLVRFHGGQVCKFPISYESFENQIYRATKLLLIMKKRKNM